MSSIVDARGLSCPQPVLMTMNEIKKGGKDEIVVLVDTETSRENVSRAAATRGWLVHGIENEGNEFRITIVRGK
jgi:tRNA 2-thiouridine synthesizing protein A